MSAPSVDRTAQAGAIPFHPFADLFPLIEGEAFAELVADVRANGLRERIKLLDGQILDGRNRYRAAIEAGLIERSERAKPGSYAAMTFFSLYLPEVDGDPLAYVISRNLRRRHLNESQRAMVAARLANLGQGRPAKAPEPMPLLPESNPAKLPEIRQAAAADLLNVSERSVRTARSVIADGAPELQVAVERGAVAVSAAATIAALPIAEQKRIIETADPKAIGAVVKQVRARRQAEKKERRQAREADLARRQRALPQKRYGVIYADPEWRWEPYSRDSGMDRAADNHYPTSDLEAIKARPVAEIAADDCVLFLWATAPMLPQALEVMAAWGFAYKTHFVWHKDRAGTGYWNRNWHELLLVGTRGQVPAPAMGTQDKSLIWFPVGEHSEKPERFAELIETYFPTLPKIELNARRRRAGWDIWGYEAPDGPPGGEGPA